MTPIPLLNTISECQICSESLPFQPKPILQADSLAQILIIGQAPGIKAHESGIPFNDASGKRLKQWLEMDDIQFYHSGVVAVMPMGFCYPGKGSSGDLPPKKACAPQWHDTLISQLPNVQVTLLIGQYSQQHYLKGSEFLLKYPTLTERVLHTKEAPDNMICLPHPSPRNQMWLKKHAWFEQDILPYLRQRISS